MNKTVISAGTGKNVTPIFDLMMGQYHTSTLIIFGRLGLFDFIHDCTTNQSEEEKKDDSEEAGVTVEQVASKANWSIRATSAMLVSLATNGILESLGPKKVSPTSSFQHKYKLTESATSFLLKGVPGSVIDYLELFWECTPQLLLEKASADKKKDNFMLETGGGAPNSLFINAMEGQTSHAAMMLSPLLAEELASVSPGVNGSNLFVDVGGGSGTFCIEMCKALPQWSGSVYELAGVCAIADDFISKAKMSDRVKAVPGDMFKDQAFPAANCYGFGNVLHDWSDDDNISLLRKAYDSLPDSGYVILLEMLVAEDVTSTTNATAGLNLVMVTNEDGRQYKASELEIMLESTGFVDIKVIASPVTPYSAVIACKK